MSESCFRCGAAMEWRHQTWQCPRCRFKIGCCEGEGACDREAVASPGATDMNHLREPQRTRG